MSATPVRSDEPGRTAAAADHLVAPALRALLTPGERPLVTVVIPCRNEERLLGRALRSLQRQTVRDIDVLIVDDASTDGTAAVVQAFARRDARIRCVPNAGRGFTDACNTGIAHSRAPLIARLDADDVSLRRRLELQLAEFARNPALVALGTYGLRVNEWGVPVGRLRTGPAGRHAFAALGPTATVNLTHSSVMFRRDVAERVGGYNGAYAPSEDFKLWNDLLAEGEVYALPQLLTLYTLRSSAMSVEGAQQMAEQMARVRRERRGDLPVLAVVPHVGAERAWAERAQLRRRVARELANGHPRKAFRLVRASDSGWGTLLRAATRSVRG
jgi:glycosyltransferase involved in cell wall biosynthesis